MGFLHDILFGVSPKDTAQEPKPDDDEQDWRVEEQRRWADQPLDDWSTEKDESKPAQADENPYHDATGSKVRPEVEIERLKANLSNDSKHLDLWATVRNVSEFTVEVTRISFAGRHTEPMRFLKPQESHELEIYRGDTPTTNAYNKAEVQYKIVDNGDYFQADHYVVYKYEQNQHGKFYVPEECKISRPVRDI